MISSIIQALFKIKIQPIWQSQKEAINNLWFLSAETKPKKKFPNNWSFFLASIKPRP